MESLCGNIFIEHLGGVYKPVIIQPFNNGVLFESNYVLVDVRLGRSPNDWFRYPIRGPSASTTTTTTTATTTTTTTTSITTYTNNDDNSSNTCNTSNTSNTSNTTNDNIKVMPLPSALYAAQSVERAPFCVIIIIIIITTMIIVIQISHYY